MYIYNIPQEFQNKIELQGIHSFTADKVSDLP